MKARMRQGGRAQPGEAWRSRPSCPSPPATASPTPNTRQAPAEVRPPGFRANTSPALRAKFSETQFPRRPSRKGLRKGCHAAFQGALDERLVDRHREVAGDRPQRHVGDNASRASKQESSVYRVLRSPKEAAAAAAGAEIKIVDPRPQCRPVAVARRHIGPERLGERAGKRLLHPGRGRISHAGPNRRDIDLDGADTETGLSQPGRHLSQGWKKRSEGGKRGAAGQGERGHDAKCSLGRLLAGRSDRVAIYRPP